RFAYGFVEFLPRPALRTCIVGIGVLIRPETVFDHLQETSNTIQACGEKLARYRIRFGNNVRPGSVSGQKIQMLLRCFGIDHAYEPEAQIGTRLCKTDRHVS